VLEALEIGWSGGDAAAFYGIVGIEADFRRESRRSFLYGDNAYLDRLRGTHFRFARDGFQPTGLQPPDWERYKAQAIEVRPWTTGGHIVVVEQSEHFLRLSGGGAGWLDRTVAELQRHTDRPLRIRRWNRAKDKAAKSLRIDLKGAHALVTWASAAAVEALLAGVPVYVMGQSAAQPMASGPLSAIEKPLRPEGREAWAAGLANSHWTLSELREGMAWRRLIEGLVSSPGVAA
jgi:hypothetical protein